jgi:hypothetical protein
MLYVNNQRLQAANMLINAYREFIRDFIFSCQNRDVFDADACLQAHIEQEVGTAGTAIIVFFLVRFPYSTVHRKGCYYTLTTVRGPYHRLSARLPTPLQSCAVVNG